MSYERKVKIILPLLVSIVLFMEFLDVSIINTAVPSISNSFKVNPIFLKFAVASYFLSLAIFVPISGWCADKFGTKNVFIYSVAMFTIASFFCALSQDVLQLTIFRFLQGVGGAFMNPVARIIVIRLFPPKDLVRVQSIMFTPALLGFIVGPFLGGVLVDYLSWHWIFYINIPVGIMAIYVGNKYITQIRLKVKKFDKYGFFLVSFSLTLISFFIEMLGHYELFGKKIVFISGIIGLILFLLLIIHCLNGEDTVFDFNLFKIKTFNIGFVINIVSYITISGVSFMLPLMFQEVYGLSALQSGRLILPIAFAQIIFRSIAPIFITRFGFKYTIITGVSLIVVMIFLMSTIYNISNISYIVFVELVYGASIVITGSSVGALIYQDIPKNRVSLAASLDMTGRQFASSVGIALVSLSLSSLSSYFDVNVFSIDGKHIFHLTFIMIAIISSISLYSVLRLDSNKK
jgi:EmrB/QacA subfamily drug resistance transporter